MSVTVPPVTGSEFVTQRTYTAPCELVWAAWTDREHLLRRYGPDVFALPQFDLRAGGILHYGMKYPGGEMWGKWDVLEVEAPHRLVTINTFSDADGGLTRHPMSATWPLKMLSVVTFSEAAGQTTVEIRWSALEATPEEQTTFDTSHAQMEQGWTGMLDQLGTYLATQIK